MKVVHPGSSNFDDQATPFNHVILQSNEVRFVIGTTITDWVAGIFKFISGI